MRDPRPDPSPYKGPPPSPITPGLTDRSFFGGRDKRKSTYRETISRAASDRIDRNVEKKRRNSEHATSQGILKRFRYIQAYSYQMYRSIVPEEQKKVREKSQLELALIQWEWALFTQRKSLKLVTNGLAAGVGSSFYVFLLLVMVLYMYTIVGCNCFAANDPFHFGSLGRGLTTMVRVTILDYWGEPFYTNYYGCDDYPAGIYAETTALIVSSDAAEECHHPKAQKILSVFFFFTYIFLAYFCILSLVIASLEQKSMASMDSDDNTRTEKTKSHFNSSIMQKLFVSYLDRKMERKLINSFCFLIQYLQDQPMKTCTEKLRRGDWKGYYWYVSSACSELDYNGLWRKFLFSLVFFTCLLIFLADQDGDQWVIIVFMNLVGTCFLAELLVRLIAEYSSPLVLFRDPSSLFEIGITLYSTFPLGTFDPVRHIWIVLRAPSLMKRAINLPQLQFMMDAMWIAACNLLFVVLYSFLFFLVSGAVGVHLFGENDPARYGDVGKAFLTNFAVATFDDWHVPLYTNMYGCNDFGYAHGIFKSSYCVHPQEKPLAAVIYFSIIAAIGYVMIVLYIAIVSAALIRRNRDKAEEENMGKSIRRVREKMIRKVNDEDLTRLAFVYHTFLDIALKISWQSRLSEWQLISIFRRTSIEMPINFHFDVWEEVANEIDMSKTKNGLKLDGFLLYVDGIASRLRAHRESIEKERISAARNLVLAAEMKKMAEVEEEIASSREESRLAEEPDTPEYLVRFANMTALVFSALVTTSAYVTPPA